MTAAALTPLGKIYDGQSTEDLVEALRQFRQAADCSSDPDFFQVRIDTVTALLVDRGITPGAPLPLLDGASS